jgi:undecaprenyl-diphosphatase
MPIGPAWLAALAADVTTLGGTPLMALFATTLAGWFARRREWVSLGMLLAATVGQAIVVQILKAMVARPRPDGVPHLVDTTSLSFPSGHAASSAAFYLTLAALIALDTKESGARRYAFLIAVLIAVAVGASRIYLGVHYPSDVIGGLAFGSAWAAIIILAARTLKKR